MIRGMLSTIYVDLTDAGEAADVQSLYEQFMPMKFCRCDAC